MKRIIGLAFGMRVVITFVAADRLLFLHLDTCELVVDPFDFERFSSRKQELGIRAGHIPLSVRRLCHLLRHSFYAYPKRAS